MISTIEIVCRRDLDSDPGTGSRKYGLRIITPVPDRRRRIIPEVVLERRWVFGVLGIWRGEGLGKGLGQGRSVYKQPETEVDGSCHS
jgi:hypothetical protein